MWVPSREIFHIAAQLQRQLHMHGIQEHHLEVLARPASLPQMICATGWGCVKRLVLSCQLLPPTASSTFKVPVHKNAMHKLCMPRIMAFWLPVAACQLKSHQNVESNTETHCIRRSSATICPDWCCVTRCQQLLASCAKHENIVPYIAA